MPELPEVETVVRTLAPHVRGKYLLSLTEVRKPCLEKASLPCRHAQGLRVADVFRRGKFIVLRLAGIMPDEVMPDKAMPVRDRLALARADDLFLVVHLRMTGTLMAYERTDRSAPDEGDWPDCLQGRYTRAQASLASEPDGPCTTAVVFNDVRTFGRLFLGTRAGLEAWPGWARLGPEPLEMGEEAFVQCLRGRRAIKSVLLDQHVLAGVGNIYADESLFAAQIRPDTPADRVSAARRKILHAELVRLLLLSIEECGSSIRNYQDADGNVGAFQNHFAVYGRAGQPCQTCGATLERTVVGGRGTVFCPKCQKN